MYYLPSQNVNGLELWGGLVVGRGLSWVVRWGSVVGWGNRVCEVVGLVE